MAPSTKIILLGTFIVVVVMRWLEWIWGREAVLWFLVALVLLCAGMGIVDRIRRRKHANESDSSCIHGEQISVSQDSQTTAVVKANLKERAWLLRFWVLVDWALCATLVPGGFFLVSITRGETLSLDMVITGWHLLGVLIGVVGFVVIHGQLWAFVSRKYSQ